MSLQSEMKPTHRFPRLLVAAAAAACAVGLSLLYPARSVAGGEGRIDRGYPTAAPAAQTLRPGARGPAVRALQSTLARLTYLPPSGVDGVFGTHTWHAVVAFQGWNHLTRDGVVGPRTSGALSHPRRPRPWSPATGMEIHIGEQVLLLVRAGRVERSIHVSTGAGGATPTGHFRIYRRESMSWSIQFRVWMPLAQYFFRGYALHEFARVPSYPASHGCVRIPHVDGQAVWQFGRTGMRVWTRA